MSYDSTILAESNLIAYYPLASNANDISSNAFNGTTHGTITFGQTALDIGLDQCALFDGSTGYITLPTNLQIAEPITIEAWIKPTSLPSTGTIVYTAGIEGSTGYAYGIEGTSSFNFYIDLNSGNTFGGSAFVANTIYYTAYTITTGQQATGYTGPVGGTVTQQITANPGGTLSYPAQGPYVGARNNNPSPVLFFPGYISSLAVYQKVLTTTQMNNHITAAHTAGRLRVMDGYGGLFS